MPGQSQSSVDNDPPQEQVLSQGENNGKGPWAAPGGWQRELAPACTGGPSCSPGKTLFKLSAGFLSFPSQETTRCWISGLQGFESHTWCLFGSPTRRWLLSQIPTLTSVLAQGAHLKVTSKWDRPASSELCGESQFPARGFWEKNILCGSTALLLNASLASQVL